MADKTTYLTYYIVLADEALVNEWNAANPNGLGYAPLIAAEQFGAPYQGYVAGTGTDALAAPFSYSPVAKYTLEESREYPYPLYVSSFIGHSGGFWGFGGHTVYYYWLGKFVYKPPLSNATGGAGGGPGAATTKRRWIEGFETPMRTLGGASISASHLTTDASRHVGGRGLAIRRHYSNLGPEYASMSKYTDLLLPVPIGTYLKTGWERFYIRVRKLPASNTVQFWKMDGYYLPTIDGHGLGITPTGQLALFTAKSNVWALVLVIPSVTLEPWTGRATHDAWRRIDVIYGLGTGTFEVYVDGILRSVAGGVSAEGGHARSYLGGLQSTDTSDLELDVDDWFNAEKPPTLDGLDWRHGSRMVHVRAKEFHAHHNAAAWPGDVRVLAQDVPALTLLSLSCTTANAVCAVETNADQVVGRDPHAIGVASILVQATLKRDTASPLLGYGLAGGTPVTALPGVPVSGSSLNNTGLMVSQQAVGPLPPILPLELQIVKGADVGANQASTLSAQVEVLGSYSACDGTAGTADDGPGGGGGPLVWAWVDKGGPAVDSPYAGGPQTADAYKAYFFSVIGKTEGSDASDWFAVLTGSGIPAGLAAGVVPTTAMPHYALTQQMGAGGVRGRVFLPTATADSYGYYSHPFDVLANAPASRATPRATEAAPLPQSDSMGPHNYPYPQTAWAMRGSAPPIAPFAAYAGTYTGNGTGQDLAVFPAPIHLFFARPVGVPTGANGPVMWFAPALSAHVDVAQGVNNASIVYVEQDPTFVSTGVENTAQERYRVRLVGAAQQVNQAGVTYQYIAVSDPGMRFMLGGTLAQRDTAGPRPFPLIDANFLGEFAFVWVEVPAGTTPMGLYARGPGNAAGVVTSFGGTKVTNALTLLRGSLTTDNGLFGMVPVQHSSICYMLVRQDDGSGDTGMAGVGAVGSYTGDGAASRTITFPPSGKRPIFAMVFPESGDGAWRDPSHTGTTSSSSSGSSLASTGITAGNIDSMTVGSALNGSGTVYSYYVLFGDATACNNGWGCNSPDPYVPVEPASPPGGGGGYPPQPNDPPPPIEPGPEEPDPGEPGGGFPGGPPTGAATPDFSVDCAPWSTYLINVALSRIGVGKQIADVATDTSEEAFKGRLIYTVTVEAVLRDFPWGFATRYADLVLVAGDPTTPANKDWTYAYRAPLDMVHARRIVGQAGEQRRYDHKPPHFRVGSDATGYLIYANAAISPGIPVQLEYTTRMPCAALEGDPLFRDALIWKLAEGLALPLARDADKANYARAQYDVAIRAAKTVAANEEQKDPLTGDAPWIRDR